MVSEAPTPPSTGSDLSRTVPYWFLAFVGLIYASGFLVVSNFLETYGLRDAGAELWKTRYIHIGVFCLMATVIPNAVAYLLIYLLSIDNNPHPHKKFRTVSTIIIYIELELGLFAGPMFGRRVGGRDPNTIIGLAFALLAVAFIGLLGAAKVERPAARIEGRNSANGGSVLADGPYKWGHCIRWLVLILTSILLCVILRMTPEMIEMIRSRLLIWLAFLSFTLLLGWLPWKAFKRRSDRSAWYLVGCLVVPIYYLSLLGFSYAVFPFIPAIRGGGDYSVAPKVFIYLKPPKESATASQPVPPYPVILLEETATAMLVASPHDAGGPCQWRLDTKNKPKISMISRDDIAGINYLSPSEAYQNCSELDLTAHQAVKGGFTLKNPASLGETLKAVKTFLGKNVETYEEETDEIDVFTRPNHFCTRRMVVLIRDKDNDAQTGLRVAVTEQQFHPFGKYWRTVVDKEQSRLFCDALKTALKLRNGVGCSPG
jgi:hypothetical protein